MNLFDAFRPKRAPAPVAASVVPSIAYQFNAPRVTPALPGFQSGQMMFERLADDNARHYDHEAARRVAAVYACMDVIASALSSSDWNVYEGVRGEDTKKAAPRDRLQYILNTRFNDEATGQAGKRAQLMAALGWGTGYAEIEWNLAGRVQALWPIHPDRCVLMRDFEGDHRLFLRVTQGWRGGMVDLDMRDVFCIRGGGLLGFAGDDKLSMAMRTIIGAIAMDEFQNAYFGNNAQLGTVFIHKGNLDESERDRVKQQLKTKHAGARRAFTTGLFTGEWDIKTFGSDAEKAAIVELKNLSVEDICRWFRVQPHKIAHLTRATNNNIEHQGLEFSRDTLRPWKVEIEQEADYKLIDVRARKFLEIDLDWAEQGDYKSRAEAYATLRNIGVFTGNDVARKLGENTFGPEGDIRIVQGANVPLEDVGAAYAAKAGDGKTGTRQTTTPEPKPDPTAAWLETVQARVQRRFANRLKDGTPRREAESDAVTYARRELEPLKAFIDIDSAMRRITDLITGAKP